MTIHSLLSSVAAAALLVAAPARSHAQSLSNPGHLPGANYAYGFGVAADGLSVVGLSDRAFRWTAAGGMQDLGTFPGGIVSQAMAASDGGSFITGYGDSSQPFSSAFRWSSAEGMVNLGTLGAASYGLAINADGSVVVGHSFLAPFGADHAFRWTADLGMQDLGTLNAATDARAQGVSADGAVVVGYSGNHAFRWTSATGMVGIGQLPGGNRSYAFGVSSDGSAVTGWSYNAEANSVAFRWTAQGGMVALGTLPTGTGSAANAISADGATVVGRADAAGLQHAFLWTAGTGLVDLNTYLPTLGLNLAGWTLTTSNGVSADGRTIVGSGTFGASSEAWIVTLPAPCPADFNHSNSLSVQDIFDFLAAWFSGFSTADFNGNGLSVQDIFDFLGAWFAGCA